MTAASHMDLERIEGKKIFTHLSNKPENLVFDPQCPLCQTDTQYLKKCDYSFGKQLERKSTV